LGFLQTRPFNRDVFFRSLTAIAQIGFRVPSCEVKLACRARKRYNQNLIVTTSRLRPSHFAERVSRWIEVWWDPEAFNRHRLNVWACFWIAGQCATAADLAADWYAVDLHRDGRPGARQRPEEGASRRPGPNVKAEEKRRQAVKAGA